MLFVLCILSLVTCAIIHESTYQVKAEDGIELNTIVYSRWEVFTDKHRIPTVLIRTPYGAPKLRSYAEELLEKHDWAIIAQDIRGTGESQGEFVFFQASAVDARSTILWAEKQKFWDGKNLFTLGLSALTMAEYVQPFASTDLPIRAQCCMLGTGLMYENTFQNGAASGGLLVWLKEVVGDAQAVVVEKLILEREEYSENKKFWEPVELEGFYQNVRWPGVHVAAWFDLFLKGNRDSFDLYKKAYDKQYLIVSAGGHCDDKSAITFPNNTFVVGLETCSDLFDPILAGEKLPDSFISFYVMGPDSLTYGSQGGNFWVGMSEFPEFSETRLYISSDGSLSSTVPSSASEKYLYDPENPTPTVGGNNLFGSCGAQDLRDVEKRSDNIFWTSDPWTNFSALVGPVTASLTVSSSRNDTDFIVRLSDVYPDGRSMYLRSGIVRMRWRGGKNEPSKLIVPGKLYEISVDLWSTAYILNPGHRLRLAVTSSSNPRYVPNRNNGLNTIQGGEFLTAENSVTYGAGSYVSLPVVSLEELNGHRI